MRGKNIGIILVVISAVFISILELELFGLNIGYWALLVYPFLKLGLLLGLIIIIISAWKKKD